MTRMFLQMVKKEIMEIVRDPRLLLGMILVPIILLPVMGLAIRGAIESTAEQRQTMVALLNLDQGHLAEEVLGTEVFSTKLAEAGVTLREVEASNLEEALTVVLSNSSYSSLLIIPEDFTQSLLNHNKAEVKAYVTIRSMSPTKIAQSLAVEIVMEAFEQSLTELLLHEAGEVEPEFLMNPLTSNLSTVYRGKILEGVRPSVFIGMVTSQLFALVFAMVILLVLASQLVATSVASEKEQKTLETLLTLPVSRTTIIVGKLAGALLVSIVGAIGFMVGLSFYMSSVMYMSSPQGLEAAYIAAALSIPMEGYLLLGGSLSLSLIASLSVVVVLAAFAEDVRSAQSLLSFVFIPVFIVAFIASFAAMESGANLLTWGMLAIPFTNPVISIIFILNGEYLPVTISLAVLLVETLALIYLATKFYSSEKVLLVRLRLKRRKEG
ncbi:MAG: hypothetical protein DRJ98_07295 [Thermoprotei archaeon]|nr:MAG: hypothetical protein DRJ98_07295 [Thermoprotei archaeon]